MIKKVIIGLGHPAHIHLFRNLITSLEYKGIEVKVIISDKDILIKLVEHYGFRYFLISGKDIKKSLFSKLLKQIRSTVLLNKLIKNENPDILIGCLSQLAISGFLLKKPVFFFGEDDFRITFLQGIIVYPFVNQIIAPEITNVGPFNYKKCSYKGYQKLAYLHPNWFNPDRNKVDIPKNERFFILRFASLEAYHDINAKGIDNNIARELINLIANKGKVIISTERPIPAEFEKYRFSGNLSDMHHYMYFADMVIGDSQTMAVEAAMLGTPNIRFNNFVGKISVLSELETKYELSYGISSSNPQALLDKINELLSITNLKQKMHERRLNMLKDKIDVSAFFVWIFENYPFSLKIMKENPDYQNRFR